ncbi:hypothetical protein QQF64_000480 [Cirrhinus molitorella]|uniref:Immunoglobulin V-set domain-containing protein n=1 Tax=Cirrhinus molitorella TaxID=172907 RepID=A0ABR3NXU8_9TELE
MKFYVFGIWICLSEIGILATDGAAIHVQGYTGKDVIITCSHRWASKNLKYFCRDPCKASNILVKSDQSPTGRYTLTDFGYDTFTVNITDLQESDSGIYWCGVGRWGFDTYIEVKMTVSNDSDTIRPASSKPATSSQSSMTKSSFSTSSASGDVTTSSPTGPVVSSRPALHENTQSSLSSGPLTITAVCLTVMVIIFGTVLCICNRQKKTSHSSNAEGAIQGTTNTTETAGDYKEITETQLQINIQMNPITYTTVIYICSH